MTRDRTDPGLDAEARVLREELRRRRVRLTLEGDDLRTEPPLRALPAELVSRIARHQAALRALLRRSTP